VVPPVPTMNVPTHLVAFNVAEYQTHIREESEKSLREVIEKHVPDELVSRSVLAEGNAADEINRIAEDESVDLIVVSTHGHSPIGRLLFGSVAERMIRHAVKPVLIVRVPDENT
jgi:nucleotide-binding universal stress UspA family protein